MDGDTASKAYTDASLAAVVQGKSLQGEPLQVATATQLSQVVSGLSQTATAMKSATVTPEACKTLTLANFATLPQDKARAVGVTTTSHVVVMLRAEADAAAAKGFVQHWAQSNAACAHYTMIPANGSAAAKATVTGVNGSPSLRIARNGSSTQGTATTTQGVFHTNAAEGTFGNVVISAASPNGSVSTAKLASIVDSMAGLLATDMGH